MERDFVLGLPGFRYADLHDPDRLADLAAAFDDALAAADPDLHARFAAHRRDPDAADPVGRSRLLIAVARHLAAFIVRLFGIEDEARRVRETTLAQDPIFVFKRDFVQRRVLRRRRAGGPPCGPFADLDARAGAVRRALFPEHAAAAADPELGTARLVAGLLDLETRLAEAARSGRAPAAPEAAARRLAAIRARRGALPAGFPAPAAAGHTGDLDLVRRILDLLEEWLAAGLDDPEGRRRFGAWVSCREPEPIDHAALVRLERPDPGHPDLVRGPADRMRRRDGFRLTDPRMTPRERLDQAHACILCHERDKDSCAKGLRDRSGALRRNPLGVALRGCPLEEKISEAHALRREGDPVAALALICLDNPMCPGTGHRICNDCMKACIFQKQEPVDIPQIETGVLTDVLDLPFGFEIWSLLTRFNPLDVRRPHALPYNGRNVLVVGMGPAGYTLAHYLLNEGFGVAGIDGLKLEPLPDDLTGADGLPPRPVRDAAGLRSRLDERIPAGFGGVSEYGITVRWDKNFLALIHLSLARRPALRIYGGIRFGGTVTVEQAWELGFDHVAIAAGAGRPTLVGMKNNMIRGVRQASDFLMALQLTGAFKQRALANLEVGLPAIVVGGGLTAIDAATEMLAYYPVQVERILERHETLERAGGGDRVRGTFTDGERDRLREFLEHGRAVRAERERAAAAGEAPDFARLVRSWGGVTVAYRKGLVDSPAYRLNHEEIRKALEEGIGIHERLDPEEAVPDADGALAAIVFRRMERRGSDWADGGGRLRLPARTLLVAAGTSPNVSYEREHPGTFALDDRGRSFRAHRAVRGAGGRPRLVPATAGDPAGFFTSYERDGRLVSFFGDNHPRYAGSVVGAMASARDGFRAIVDLLGAATPEPGPEARRARAGRLRELFADLDDRLRPRVVEVRRLTPSIVEVVARAPQAARNFRPGQFFRVQNFETLAPRLAGHALLMEPLALTGAWVDPGRGLLGLIALEVGVSSRLCAALRPGEPLVVMGPTGAPTDIPPRSTILLAGGGLGNAVLFSIAREARSRGCRVIYFAGYKRSGDLFRRDAIEAATDVVVWSVDTPPAIATGRPQDRSMVGNIVEAMLAYATGALGTAPIPLREADRIIAIGSDRMMAAVARARRGALAPHLNPDHVGIGSINSPMQCMMKQVCGQCLQRHLDPITGRETGFVFSCLDQDQPLDRVDWMHLRQRLSQNSVQEKLANLWLDHLLAEAPAVPARGAASGASPLPPPS
jgi:NADPH-dependent glutamate synthase beta subunit-like oxidoreductase/NAD(P)H-flavin reductase